MSSDGIFVLFERAPAFRECGVQHGLVAAMLGQKRKSAPDDCRQTLVAAQFSQLPAHEVAHDLIIEQIGDYGQRVHHAFGDALGRSGVRELAPERRPRNGASRKRVRPAVA